MAHIVPDRIRFEYRIATNPDGTIYVGRFKDGGTYYNIVSVSPREVATPVRIVARAETIEDARLLEVALNRYTVRG